MSGVVDVGDVELGGGGGGGGGSGGGSGGGDNSGDISGDGVGGEVEDVNGVGVGGAALHEKKFENDELFQQLVAGYTEEQMEDIRKSFDVFDIDKDGDITVEELFTVLKSMGKSTSEEEVRQTIASVDLDMSGTMDFKEFVLFLRKLQSLQQGAGGVPPTVKYAGIVDIKVRKNAESPLKIYASSLILLYNVLQACLVAYLVGMKQNMFGQNPSNDSNDFGGVIRIIRIVNYANFLHVFSNAIDEKKRKGIYIILSKNGYKQSLFNYVKFLLRGLFLLNLVSSVLLVLGAQSKTEQGSLIAAAQVVSAYLSLSYFGYFDTVVVPASWRETLTVMLLDLLLLNPVRLISMVVKNVVLVVMIPFILLLSIYVCFAAICGWGLSDDDDNSCINKFLALIQWLSG